MTTILAHEFSMPQAAVIGRVDVRNLGYWLRSGLVKPAKPATGRGRWHAHKFTYRELVAIRTIGELRAEGLSLQKIRRAVEALRRDWPQKGDLSGAKLVFDGEGEVYLVLDEKRVVGLLRKPGQIALRSVFDVDLIAREVRAAAELEVRRAA